MQRVPWTKFQDFYLRIGFLKVLVALLDPHRRSVSSDTLSQRLSTVLFRSLLDVPQLQNHIRAEYSWFPPVSQGKERTSAKPSPNVAEALLLTANSPSQLLAVTAPTTHKLLEWGRDIDFVGSGNQIAENGLLLRTLLPQDRIQQFMQGSIDAWNPFVITLSERLYFLFCFCEVDHITLEIVASLGGRPPQPLETSDAAEITCRAFFTVLEQHKETLPFRELPRFRVTRDLACTMAIELDLPDLKARCGSRGISRLPNRVSIRTLQNTRRRTTKNSDHQTIPRFEQLVDLGFLTKPMPAHATAQREYGAKRRWKYQPTALCASWGRCWTAPHRTQVPWHWSNFADSVVKAGIVGVPSSKPCDPTSIARYFWNAYLRIRRPVGHTPFQSVAVLAMIDAVTNGHVVELEDFHNVLWLLKQDDLLSDHAFFSGGNEIDRMFVLLKPGFIEAFDRQYMSIHRRRPPQDPPR